MSLQVLLDTETTGLDPKKGHRLTEIGCLEMKNRKLTGRKFQTYLNPEREVEANAAAITGLTWEMLKDKPKFIEIVDDFIEFIGGAELIIHNAPFDLGFLNAELARLNHAWQPLEAKCSIFDTLVLARRLHPGQKNNLDALCERYKIDNSHRQYHGALLDADILAKVYLSMTAGQRNLAFGSGDTESTLDLVSPTPTKNIAAHAYPRVKRAGNLVVIKATEAECTAHNALYSDA